MLTFYMDVQVILRVQLFATQMTLIIIKWVFLRRIAEILLTDWIHFKDNFRLVCDRIYNIALLEFVEKHAANIFERTLCLVSSVQ